ncbi:hypothetical protein [Rhodococcus sp. IEGM 1379]|uniref:hypothetical protein n=1 Tax=Rhodococcus sp. IEGM 1379 TaxID=3047086 RepID=UPI0024B757D9|nr:hypothetical protein [Rhodococcus sp. IEGM 1379]MDI9913705.1 hypothetical protein [Rhodococcus sp. IEGM 1379]
MPEIGDQILAAGQYWGGGGVCRYITEPDGNTVFAGVELLPESLDQLFTGFPLAGECSVVASIAAGMTLSLAETGRNDVPVLVEIDGCRRVLVDGYIPLQASSDVIGQVDSGVHLTDQYLRTGRRSIRSGVLDATDGRLG